MKKLAAIVLALCFLLPFTAFTEGNLTVLQKNFHLLTDKNSGYFFAKVENTGDAPLYADNGTLEIFAKDNTLLVTETYLDTNPGYLLLQPGEQAYLCEYIWNDALENVEIGDVKLIFQTRDRGYSFEKVASTVAYDTFHDDRYDNFLYVTFTNDTDATMFDYYISVAILDEGGNILLAEGNAYETVGIHPGSTVTVKVYVKPDLLKHWTLHDLTMHTVESHVYYPLD